LTMLAIFALLLAAPGGFETGVVQRSTNDPFYQNAIPSIARLNGGKLLCVWTCSGKQDKKMRIVGSLSSDGGRTWSNARTLIDTPGKNDADPVLLVAGSKVWVYSATVNIPDKLDRSAVFMVSSEDQGAHWSTPRPIHFPRKYTGAMVNNGLRVRDGTLLLPFAWDRWAEQGMAASTEGEMDLGCGVLLSRDGVNWTQHGDLHIWEPKVTPGSTNGLAEPAVVELKNGELLMIMRTGSSHHWQSRSRDGGITWDAPRASPLTGHNTPTALWRLDNPDTEIIAIWNNSPLHRYPLSVAISKDGGRTWSRPKNVATSEGPHVSYPGIVQAGDGTFVAVWQQQLAEGGREIRWARFTRDWVLK